MCCCRRGSGTARAQSGGFTVNVNVKKSGTQSQSVSSRNQLNAALGSTFQLRPKLDDATAGSLAAHLEHASRGKTRAFMDMDADEVDVTAGGDDWGGAELADTGLREGGDGRGEEASPERGSAAPVREW
jgi:hypothetical protein